MTESLELYDVTIIGGGPAGMYTAFYSGMRDMKTKLIEAKHELGGRMRIYPEKMIWDVGGVTPILCEKLIDQLEQQARTFEPTIVLGQQITGMDRQEDGTFLLTSATGEQHWTRTIVLAVGYGILKMAKLEIEGADRYEVTNLHYTVQELEPFRDKHVLISGGGNSAVDWANELESIAASVTVVHRRDHFGGHEKNVARMKSSSVRVLTPYAVSQLHSNNGETIEQVTINHVDTGEIEMLNVDAVIVNHGLKSDFGPLRDWGLDMGEWHARVSDKLETNLPGIFAAGDFVEYGSKLYLIAGTFTDAALALNSAKLYIDPTADKAAYVSSHNSRFKEKNRELGVVE
ncbi:NAD(P)/FAD-dependent oxidoreductase [Paenibacillus polymyxa]|uniref:Ferredoxin--NADP reductase n=1 Tax=Paenibacillus polymyxa TaxID=1406 RepID=A0A378XWX5_PAEPO|nr:MULTISPECIES: NAD(P)/FAD-dependent oxidoreductase [Paenibacillus]MDP9676365.1 thioredoxin reductase (NADPH) [Paenibacillus jamilae]AUS25649.1 ferredoxin--NADP reductase [Paenibacillus polymyxa]KAF6585154.1 NAD(P)/FAD-dependent oxidoreductase [Paenibacillus sp. EKM211P]KAF6619355.1 NAD(P)/FAD-dependent oxidoreductase [Paenibacillus sp. EKM101P]KAF6624447.1 NAD(P)/FAD-dependent oxidoreductase [Paenibacillus sp. EKM102P]